MKIERFNSINENLASDVKQFAEDFTGNTDSGIIDWISVVGNETKLSEYKNFTDKKALNFAKSRNLKKVLEYLPIDKEIEKKEKELEQLNTKKEKLKIEAGAELLYNFQEDLFNRDFNSFYKFFIEDGVEESNGDIEDILRFSEIHPKILKKYRDKIIIGISANKYNI